MKLAGHDATRSPQVAEAWLAALFVAGGTLGLLAMLMPHWHQTDTFAEVLLSLCAYPGAVVLMITRGRLGPWFVHCLLVFGSVLITVSVYYGHGGPGSIVTAMLYIWIALYVCMFFSWPRAGMHLVLAGVGYGVVLWILRAEDSVALWLFVLGTAVVSGVVVAALVRQLREIGRIDGLTGVLNRRALEEELAREFARAKRLRTSLSAAVIDLDHFKECNDTLGHRGGDAMLMDTTRSWTARLRDTDCLARYGGDEFALVLPDASLDDAVAMLQRLRHSSPPGLQFSAGVTSWNGAETPDELLARADSACYRAKRRGRNQTATIAAPASSHAPMPG